jgi:hypothetical protein
MYEYKCIERYCEHLAAELTRLSKEGWELVGQPISKNGSVYFATLRRSISYY